MATRIVVNGCAGRMGQRIASLALDDSALTLVGALEREGHPSLGLDLGTLLGKGGLGVKIVPGLSSLECDADVIIDFTSPPSSVALAKQAGARGLTMVIGTTGLSEEEKASLQESLAGHPWVLAPNMSVGVNLLFKLAHDVARILGESFDAEIVETHHRFKADAPSGTALRLAEEIARARGVSLEEKGVHGRSGKPGARPAGEIGVLAVRAGDVVGEHTVVFGGIGERVELVHKAHTRDNFALGALRAAKWIADQPPGMYDMMDVLGIR